MKSKLQIWWNSNHRGRAFTYPVDSLEQARDVLNALAIYDVYLNQQDVDVRVAPKYSGLEVWDDEANDWVDWTDKKGRDIWETPL
jgi:hypothetical protein